MSSVKLDSRDSGCSTWVAGAMKVPEPQRWTSMPFSTRPAIALRTVTREIAKLPGQIAFAGQRLVGL